MKKLFINIVICFVTNMLFAQTSFNSVTTITPSSLPQLNGNIYQKDNTNCFLYGYDYGDMLCTTSRESEVVSFAVRNLAVAKYGSWSDAEFTPIFIENRITTTNNVEQNLLSALNVVKSEGIPSISFEFEETEIPGYTESSFDAALNTINYGKLQSASDTNLIKNVLDKGYPVIVYFQSCREYIDATLETYVRSIWGESLATGINRNISEEPYLTAVIVGYEKVNIYSRNQEELCFIMYCPNEINIIDNVEWNSKIIYVPFCKVAENIFDYAIVPHSLSPYKYPPTEIEGPDYLVCTKTYQVSNLPPTATISWRKESTQIVLIGSTTSNSVTASYAYIAQNNSVEPYLINPTITVPKIIATITYNGHNLELEKRLYVTNNIAPSVMVEGPMMASRLYSGSTYTFKVTNAEYSDDSSIVWDITLPNGTKQYKTGKNVQITPTSSGTLKVNVENIDGCTPNNISSYSYSVIGFGQLQYNNPASETLYVQIVEQNENSRAISEELNYYDDEYTLELYDKNTTLVRKVRIQPNASQIQIPVSDLMPGYYYLRLVIDNQVVNIEQIIIN